MGKGAQHDLPRKGRVNIVYEDKTSGAENIDLPFVALVVGDFSGERQKELEPLKTRDIPSVTSENKSINDLVATVRPTVTVTIPDRLSGDGQGDNLRKIKVTMQSMDDFNPDNLVQKIPELRALMEVRNQLKSLLRKLDGNVKAEKMLAEIIEAARRRALQPAPAKSDETAAEPKEDA